MTSLLQAVRNIGTSDNLGNPSLSNHVGKPPSYSFAVRNSLPCNNSPLQLRYCQPSTEGTRKETLSKVPVWVKFFNVPLAYWSFEGLSHIASAIGKPLFADSLTESKKRISFVRICVELDTNDELIDSFDLNTLPLDSSGDAIIVEIRVEYQWRPKICSKCKVFGHSDSSCPHNSSLTQLTQAVAKDSVKNTLAWVPVGTDLSNGITPQFPFVSSGPNFATEKTHSIGIELVTELHTSISPTQTIGTYIHHQHSLNPNSPMSPSTRLVITTSNAFHALAEDDGLSDQEFANTATPNVSLWPKKLKGKNIDGVPMHKIQSYAMKSKSKKRGKNGISSNAQVIHCKMNIVDLKLDLFASFVYGSNDDIARRDLWSNLVAQSIMVSNIPWIILGDFNVTQFTNEVVGGVQGISSAMNKFDLCINNANVVDLIFNGVQFTWCNKRDNGSIAKKLDGFFNFLADREDFLSIVHDAWHSSVRGTFQYQVCYKLKMVKQKLKCLNHSHVQDVTIKAREAKHALDCCQRDLDVNVFDLQLREQEKLFLKSYSDAILAKESFFRQKARVQWLNLGIETRLTSSRFSIILSRIRSLVKW
ncbi:hypothetical protein PS2_027954 [Malus domestica]